VNNFADKRKLIFILSAIAFLVMYIEAMLIPSMPDILYQTNYSISYAEISWVITIYLLTATVSMPLFGKLSDMFGRKKVLLISLIIYSISVSLAGYSQTFTELIIFRGIQGIGAAVFPISYAIIKDQFKNENLGVAQGILSSMFALGASFGIIFGSIITNFLGWQWTYLTIFPFVYVVSIFTYITVPKDEKTKKGTLDYIGTVMLSFSLLFIIVVIGIIGSNVILNFDLLLLLILGLTIFVLFLVYENMVDNPLINIKMLKNDPVMISNITAILGGITQFIIYQPLVFLITNTSPYGFSMNYIMVGLLILPYSLTMMIVAPITGKKIGISGPEKFLFSGFLIMSIGYFALSFLFNKLLFLEILLVIISSGLSMVLVSSVNILSNYLPGDIGALTSFNMISRTLGGLVGGATSGIFLSIYYVYVPVSMYAPVGIKTPTELAYFLTFLIGGIVSLFGLFVVLFYSKIKRFQ